MKIVVEHLRQKETSLNNLLSKVRIIPSKGSKKEIAAENIEKYVMDLDQENEKYKKCIEDSLKTINGLIMRAKKRQGEFSFFFKNIFNVAYIHQDTVEFFHEHLASIISFADVIFNLKILKCQSIVLKKFILLEIRKIFSNKYSTNNNHKTSLCLSTQMIS